MHPALVQNVDSRLPEWSAFRNHRQTQRREPRPALLGRGNSCGPYQPEREEPEPDEKLEREDEPPEDRDPPLKAEPVEWEERRSAAARRRLSS